MPDQQVFLFEFIEDSCPPAAQAAQKMEQLIFEDSASSIVKARLFMEEILKGVFAIEDIDTAYISTSYEKISYLASEGIIKKEIQFAFDSIRRTGNKAAHNSEFDDLGAALQLHKEMYKIAVWFYETYTSNEMAVPKYYSPKPNLDLERKIEDALKNFMGSDSFPKSTQLQKEEAQIISETDSIKEGPSEEVARQENTESSEIDINTSIEAEEVLKVGSYLTKELLRLKDSAKEAIENANTFSEFKKYLHVDRKIQTDLESMLLNKERATQSQLILLCGSVGDGKSHLLAYLNEKYPEIMEDFFIHNDATESFSPDMDAMDTLEEVLKPYSDEEIDYTENKTILAINLGVLHNFIYHPHKKGTFTKLKEFIEKSGLFSTNIVTGYEENKFSLLNFTDYHPYELTSTGPVSSFYEKLLMKVFEEEQENPFYRAYLKDEQLKNKSLVHINYDFLRDSFVQKQVIKLVIEAIVKDKLVISTRAFLNFIADILIPGQIEISDTSIEQLNKTLPSLLFEGIDRSPLLNSLSKLDPIHIRSAATDQLIIELNTLNDWKNVASEYVKNQTAYTWLSPTTEEPELLPATFSIYFESFLRTTYLTNPEFSKEIQDKTYVEYMNYLYKFNKKDMNAIKQFYENFKRAILLWKGVIKKSYILLNHPIDKYKLAQNFSPKPTVSHLTEDPKETLFTFKSTIKVGYEHKSSSEQIFVDIDYPLYLLLSKVETGYRPNKQDEEEAIKFVEFLEKIMQFGDKRNELMINFPAENKFYKIKRDDFGTLVFERE